MTREMKNLSEVTARSNISPVLNIQRLHVTYNYIRLNYPPTVMGCRIDVEEALDFLVPRRSPVFCLRSRPRAPNQCSERVGVTAPN